MIRTFLMVALLLNALPEITNAQKVIYSEPNKDDLRQTSFEIIGKYGSNVLIYKNLRNKNVISVYDADMKETDRMVLEYLPDRLLNVDFLPYPDHAWMVYQYQQRSIVHCMAVKLDATGKKTGEPIELDTTDINYNSSNKLYTVLSSDDKKKVMIFKINSKNEKQFHFKTLLFDNGMSHIRSSRIGLPMKDRFDLLSDFSLNNEGDLTFALGDRTGNDQNITKLFLIRKHAAADTFAIRPIKLEGISLDEVRVKSDNFNNRIVITSFYYKGRKNVIDGIFHSEWDRTNDTEVRNMAIPLGEDIRIDAKGENNIKNAFDDYFLKQIILKKDGGFAIAAECLYTTTRGSNSVFNRWDYLSYPYMSPIDQYYWNYGNAWGYPYNRWGNSVTRFNADNIVVLSFDNTGKLQWSNVIRKSQYDDESEAPISYQYVNTGDAIRFLYNDFEKRNPILSVQSIDPNGQIIRNPTLKNLDRGYSFLPRYAKQVGQRQVIVPCLYRNFLAFAKVEF